MSTESDLEEVIEDLIVEMGPLSFSDLMIHVATETGHSKQDEIDAALESGPFVKDDSGRYHLSSK